MQAILGVQERCDRMITASLAPRRLISWRPADQVPELVPGPCAEELVRVGTDRPLALLLTAG